MSRELRRVPLDFDWPLNKVWKGYVNPHYKPCPKSETNECHGGATNASTWVMSVARLMGLLGEQAEQEPRAEQLKARGQIFPHPYLEEWAQAPREDMPRAVRLRLHEIENGQERQREFMKWYHHNPPKLLTLTDEMVQFIRALAGTDPSRISGDYSYDIYRTLLKTAGIDPKSGWGTCKTCNGDGTDPSIKEAYEAWKKEAPPEGEGWQLWETVSDGSPISKVYATRDEFVAHLMDEGYSRKAAEAFCETGWAPSGMMMVADDGESTMYSDIHALDITD